MVLDGTERMQRRRLITGGRHSPDARSCGLVRMAVVSRMLQVGTSY